MLLSSSTRQNEIKALICSSTSTTSNRGVNLTMIYAQPYKFRENAI